MRGTRKARLGSLPGGGNQVFVVNTVSNLLAFKPSDYSVTDGSRITVNCLGYYEAWDRGGGYWAFDPDSAADVDGGTLAGPNGIGRWIPVGSINPRRYGAKGDGVTDDGPAVRAAWKASGYDMTLPEGKFRIDLANSPLTNGVRVGLHWGIRPALAALRFSGPRLIGESGVERCKLIFDNGPGLGLVWTGIANFLEYDDWVGQLGHDNTRQLYYHAALKNVSLSQSASDPSKCWNIIDHSVFSSDIGPIHIEGFKTEEDDAALVLNQCWNLHADKIYIEGNSRTSHGLRVLNANQQYFSEVFTHGFADGAGGYGVRLSNAEGTFINLQDQAKSEYGLKLEANGNKGGYGPLKVISYHEGSARPIYAYRNSKTAITLVGSNIVNGILSISGLTGNNNTDRLVTTTTNWPAFASVTGGSSAGDGGLLIGQKVSVGGVTNDASYNGLVTVVDVVNSTQFIYRASSAWSSAAASGSAMVATQHLAFGTCPKPHILSPDWNAEFMGFSDAAYNGVYEVGYVPQTKVLIYSIDKPFTDANPTGGFVEGQAYVGGVELHTSGLNAPGGNKNSLTNIPRNFVEADYAHGWAVNSPHMEIAATRTIAVTNISTNIVTGSMGLATNTATFTTSGNHQFVKDDWLGWRILPGSTYPANIKVDAVPAANQFVGRFYSYKSVAVGEVANHIIHAANKAILWHTNTSNMELITKPFVSASSSQDWFLNEAPEPWFTTDRTTWNNGTATQIIGGAAALSRSNLVSDASILHLTALNSFGISGTGLPVPVYPKAVFLRYRFNVDAVGSSGRVVADFGRLGDATQIRMFTETLNAGNVEAGHFYEGVVEVPCWQRDGHYTAQVFVTSGQGWQVDFELWEIGSKR